MAQGPDGKTIIIVKKVAGHGGHHGGSWKVAYADFVTSMMCFFLVMWLVNSASVSTRERIASYFRTAGIFEKGSGTPIQIGGAGVLADTFAPPAEGNAQIEPSNRIYDVIAEEGDKAEHFGRGGGEGTMAQGEVNREQELQKLEQLVEKIKELAKRDKNIMGMIGQMDVKLDQKGLHLEIMDTPNASMFVRGSSQILPDAEKELLKIAELLKKFPNPIDIEGHTDGAPFRGKAAEVRDNWMLSTERANAARKVFEKAGIPPARIARVVGYADQRLKVKDNPLADANRRISISMRYHHQAAEILREAGVVETRLTPLRMQGAESSAQGKGLAVELTTTPEGQDERGQEQPQREIPADETPARPLNIEKDKIFGDENPFFGKY